MVEVSVRFLGSGDAFGSGGRFQTCMYLRSEAAHLLVDCGASSLVAMKRFGVDPSLVDTILLSHLHGDHFGGIPFFILDARYASRREKPLTVAGPPGLEARVWEAMEVLYPDSSKVQNRFALRFVELGEGTETTFSSFAVTPYNVEHHSGAPSYALRIALDGKVLAYSGDTQWTDALITVSRGADVFVCECNFFEKAGGQHLDYQTLMDHRAELDCRRLILTHMGDAMLHRLGDLAVEGAEDGKVVVL